MYGNRNGQGAGGAPYNHLVSPTGKPAPNTFSETTSIADLRRQQEAFHRVREKLDLQNSWMAIPALAPVAVPFIPAGLIESVAAKLAGEAAVAITRPGPLNLINRGISHVRGENIYARAGRQAHQALKERVKAKEAAGWEYEPGIKGSALKPDVGTPRRNPLKPDNRNHLELKPNTLSGRQAAARQIRKHQNAFDGDQRVRGIFYDPKDFLKDLP